MASAFPSSFFCFLAGGGPVGVLVGVEGPLWAEGWAAEAAAAAAAASAGFVGPAPPEPSVRLGA